MTPSETLASRAGLRHAHVVGGIGIYELFCVLGIAAITLGGPLIALLVVLRLKSKPRDDTRG
ncbi:MAG TPA: hypothetical protein RMH99_25430 [Sandaracinaceae bacterium LLY-WYZ-13_1]|nr:hypothetical protein [Sandaracinaceae bacterium LLY-WYZ-13_1]